MVKHKYLDNPIISIIYYFIILCILQIPGFVVNYFLDNALFGGIISIIVSIIAVLIFYRHFEGEFKGGLLKTTNFKKGLTLLIPLFLYLIVYNCLIEPINLNNLTISLIPLFATLIAAAFVEEVVFRGFIISNFMRFWNRENRIVWVALISGIIFGLIHLGNAFGPTGASLNITLDQVIVCIGSGVFLAAIFLRTGNLWVTIFGHAFNNFMAGLHPETLATNGLMTATQLNVLNYLDVAFGIALLIIGLYYIRKAKRSDIISLWDERWN